MKKLISLVSLSSLLMLNLAIAGPARDQRDGAVYDYANVVKVVPIVRQVKISTPTRECWEETVVESVPHRPGVSGSAIVGGLVGGLLGSQFGNGGGQVAMTMLGIAVGSTVGQSASHQGAASAETVSYPVEWRRRVQHAGATRIARLHLPQCQPGRRLRDQGAFSARR